MGYLENRVHVQIFIGVDRLACRGVDWQVRRIDHVPWVASHVQNVGPRIWSRSGHDALTCIESAQVLIEGFEVGDFSTGRTTDAICGPRREHSMVPGVVVVD